MPRHHHPVLSVTGLAALLLASLLTGGCASSGMPALTDTDTGERLPGKVVWHDLITDTPAESKQFYAELFGWEFEEAGNIGNWFQRVDYTLIRHNGQLIGGLIDQAQLETRADISQWVSLISVADIEAATAAVEASGGRVLSGPLHSAARGSTAAVIDPQGALITLVESASGDPLDPAEIAAGAFLWDELWADDAGSAARFYQALAGYQEADLDGLAVGDSGYRVLTSQDRPRVGIMPMPVRDLEPTWVSYLRVKNAAELDAIVARVEALGGSILLDPQDRDLGGRVALIAGPSGAGIALQTWPFDEAQ